MPGSASTLMDAGTLTLLGIGHETRLQFKAQYQIAQRQNYLCRESSIMTILVLVQSSACFTSVSFSKSTSITVRDWHIIDNDDDDGKQVNSCRSPTGI